jgi:glucose/arabinose dehydrogenase
MQSLPDRRRRPTEILVVLFGALALVFAACAGTDTAPTTATQTTSPSTTAPELPATTAVAPPSTTTSPSTTAAPDIAANSTTTTTLPPEPLQGLTLEVVATDLDRPNYVTSPPGDDRLFVAERKGGIAIIENDQLRDQRFIDLSDRVKAFGIEQGLLGLAFHPDYATNGRFYVYFTDEDDQNRLQELRVDPGDPYRADPGSTREIMRIEHVRGLEGRHNGGMIQFGPDGYLYISVGDGEQASIHGQDPNTLRAAILRIDVDNGDPYAIPADNPFVDGGGAPEVWAFGLRNPWRFSIDHESETIYIGDVGQERWEEIDAVPLEPAGYNFGWIDMEGSHCYTSVCDEASPVLPVVDYSHEEGCSVTGGWVYRGAAIPELRGHYFYADWCFGWIRSFELVGGAATNEQDWTGDFAGLQQPNGFGVDDNGEIYVATWTGIVARIVPVR